MRRWLIAVTLSCAALSPTAGASAQTHETGFWRSVREPGYARAMHLMRQGLFLMASLDPNRGDRGRGRFEANAILEGAIARFALAHRYAPTEAAFVYFHADATSRWERPDADGASRMDDEALALFREVRALDSSFEAANVASAIAILHTRAHRFSEAVTEYHYAIARSLDPNTTAWANLAEVTMLAGDVEEAVRLFERSIAIANSASQMKVLAQWGLAVALDRLGEHRHALEIAGVALGAADGSMSPIHAEGVFYEPAYEIHWYEGLGHAALAEQAEDTEDRAREQAEARRSFRRYLAEGGRESPWAALAERHAEELSTAGAGRRGRRRR